MSHSDQSKVSVRVEDRENKGAIAFIAINNRRKLNALDRAVLREFSSVCRELERNPSLRAAVVTGAGERAFSAGVDIDELAALDRASAREFITLLHDCCHAVRELPVPVIARIQGYALGGGLELAASCDLRIASETGVFGMPEVKLGIPSVIEAAFLPSLVGWGRTRQMLLLGESFGASDAAAWGLVERTVPVDQLDEAVETCIQSILEAGPNAVRLQKKLIQTWEELPLARAIEAGIDAFVEAWTTDEPRLAIGEAQTRGRRQKP